MSWRTVATFAAPAGDLARCPAGVVPRRRPGRLGRHRPDGAALAAVWLRAAGAQIAVDGLGHLTSAAPRVIVSNHQSSLGDRAASLPGLRRDRAAGHRQPPRRRADTPGDYLPGMPGPRLLFEQLQAEDAEAPGESDPPALPNDSQGLETCGRGLRRLGCGGESEFYAVAEGRDD